jgi:hypothetical protein
MMNILLKFCKMGRTIPLYFSVSLSLCFLSLYLSVSLSFCLSVFLLFYLSVSSSGYISTNITVCHQCAGDTRLAVRRPRELVLNVTADCGAA